MAAPAFDFVPYHEQVQRLQKSAIEEAQRARTHVLPFPPAYWIIEPGDVGTWNSTRNGYIDKLFRVDSVVDRGNLDLFASVTEIDPTDYDWTHATDYTGVATGPTAVVRPAPQGVKDWFVEPYTLYDDLGSPRRAAIRLVWDGTLPGVSGVSFEVRLASTLVVVHRGTTDQVIAGAIIISQNLLSDTDYEARGQYIPSSPREMLWSAWLPVTTPDVDEGAIDQQIREEVRLISNYLNDEVAYGMQLIASTASNNMANTWLDNMEVRTETETAFASYKQVVSAQVGATNASVTTNASAIATLNGYAAAQYSVTLDVNGYATGFNLFNGGVGISTATFVQDKFQIAAPGIGGGAPVPIFTVANVAGSPKIAIRGDVYADGTVNAIAIVAGSITSDSGAIGTLSVKALSIGDFAVVVPVAETRSDTFGNVAAYTEINSVTLSFDTTGLSGKSLTIIAGFVAQIGYTGSPSNPAARLVIDGTTVQTVVLGGAQVGTVSLTGSKAFTAGGGAESKTIKVEWLSTTNATISGRTLWAMVGKR